ncbi:MAG: hypothetical protein L6W00_03205 [Lentisphaeria bacterium]|nr:MAG: hypothetical protein L6W00_03205 [Lentisphaeria bacterium]
MSMRGCGDYNYRKLLWFQGFNSVAIALGANWVVSDMILLRADFDLVSFGVVKSSMFLLPALSYWAAAGVLRRWNRDRLVCFWSYLARAVLPLGDSRVRAVDKGTGDSVCRVSDRVFRGIHLCDVR